MMDQEQIGLFISELRKENGLTQQQLADILGVTNKTISRWECGRGMPELSSIEPLCTALHINVNELLSGERLPNDLYSKKAEENIMELIHETEQNTTGKNSIITILVSTFSALFCVIYNEVINNRAFYDNKLIDTSALLGMLIVVILSLFGTNSFKYLGKIFSILSGNRKYTKTELKNARTVISLMQSTLLITGFIMSMFGYLSTAMYIAAGDINDREVLAANIAINSLGILYGLICFLFLLPIQKKLELLSNHITKGASKENG